MNGGDWHQFPVMDARKTGAPNSLRTSFPPGDAQPPHATLEVLPAKHPSPENVRQNGGPPCSPQENPHQRSPSPRYRHYSGSTTPTRTPTPTFTGDAEERAPVKTKSVSFHSHTNWKKDRKIHSGEYLLMGRWWCKGPGWGRKT